MELKWMSWWRRLLEMPPFWYSRNEDVNIPRVKMDSEGR
jgi:hypothetical protein